MKMFRQAAHKALTARPAQPLATRLLALGLLAGVTGTSVLAQDAPPLDMAAIQPVVIGILKDEIHLHASARDGDAAMLKLLHWRSIETAATFAAGRPPEKPDDAARMAVTRAHDICADAYAKLGLIAGAAFDVVTTNRGGEVTELLNITARERINAVLIPFHEARRQCSALTAAIRAMSLLAYDADEMFPAFVATTVGPISAADRAELAVSLDRLNRFEQALAGAVAAQAPGPIEATAAPFAATMVMLERLRDARGLADLTPALKPCDWAMRLVFELTHRVHEGVVRPQARVSVFADAREPLADYRRTKAQCAVALKAPEAEGVVALNDDFTRAPAR